MYVRKSGLPGTNFYYIETETDIYQVLYLI